MEGGIVLPFESNSKAEASATSFSDEEKKSSSNETGVVTTDLKMLMEVHGQQILLDLVDRFNESVRLLSRQLADIEILRQENEALWAENHELSLLLQEQQSNLLVAAHEGCGILDLTPFPPLIGADENVAPGEGIITGKEKSEVTGILPKSISIRSKGFLAPGKGVGITEEASASSDSIPRNSRPLPLGSIQVGEADGVGYSVEVFNQGVAKTELCNKWEEMGWCPYGDQCQFAHGVDELRPVIRHPRYKTQLCRMVTGPGGCPYGHRCHFRHAQPTQNSQ